MGCLGHLHTQPLLSRAFLSPFVAMPLSNSSEDLEHNNPACKSNPGARPAVGGSDCAHSEKLTCDVAQQNEGEKHKMSEVWNKEVKTGSCKQDKSEAVGLAWSGTGSS